MAVVTSDPEVIFADISAWVTRQSGAVAARLAYELHGATPVDTGYAQSNWVVSIGSPNTSQAGARAASHREAAIDDARFYDSLALLVSWDLVSPVYITNNVEYIGRLNDGWSAQAPAGFIELALARAMAQSEVP